MVVNGARARLILAAFLLLVACREGKTVDLIKDVAAEARAKPRIHVTIRSDDAGLLRSIEERVDRARVGRLVGSGSTGEILYLTIEVEKTAEAIDQLRRELKAAGVLEQSSFRVSAGDDR